MVWRKLRDMLLTLEEAACRPVMQAVVCWAAKHIFSHLIG